MLLPKKHMRPNGSLSIRTFVELGRVQNQQTGDLLCDLPSKLGFPPSTAQQISEVSMSNSFKFDGLQMVYWVEGSPAEQAETGCQRHECCVVVPKKDGIIEKGSLEFDRGFPHIPSGVIKHGWQRKILMLNGGF